MPNPEAKPTIEPVVNEPTIEPTIAAAETTPAEKSFTQAQLNNYLKAEKKKWEKKSASLKQDVFSELGIQGVEDIEKLNELRARIDSEEKDKLEAKGKFDEILERNEKKRMAEIDALTTTNVSIARKFDSYRKKVILTDIALKAQADPANIDMLVSFIEKDIKITDDAFSVIDYDGQAKLDPDTGKEITLETYIKSVLAARPNLMKSSGTGGSGSSGTAAHAGMTMDKLRDLAVEDPAKYEELRNDGTVQRVINEYHK